MFLQLVLGGMQPAALFDAHPRWITALAEYYWNNRRDNFNQLDRMGWSQGAIDAAVQGFAPALPALAPAGPTFDNTTDHIAYAWSIENTRIYDIFAKVLKTYRSGDQLGKPRQSRRFWDTTERLFFSAPPSDTMWNISSSLRADETAQRISTYWSMLGLSLAPSAEAAQGQPYQKPAAANTEFVPAFESFARAVWCGIVNRQNNQGLNYTDNEAIASGARHLSEMFAALRMNGNLAREEFRSVAIMSWLHLAVRGNSPAVEELGASAGSPDQRLLKIATRVGMSPHPKSRALFDLSLPLSTLLTLIERNTFSNNAQILYMQPRYQALAERVIGHYSQAMGRDLKAMPVTVGPQEPPPERLPSPQRPLQLVSANQQAGNSSQTAQPAQAN